MAPVLRITVETGPHKHSRYCLRGPSQCLIGRDPACLVHLCGSERDSSISRRHCQLAFDPDDLSLALQDLSSSNGTYLNGCRIEGMEKSLPDEPADPQSAPGQSNWLTVGGTTLRIDVVDCPPKPSAADSTPAVWAEGETTKKDCPVRCQS